MSFADTLSVVITAIFLLTLLSYYLLLFLPKRKAKIVRRFKSVTVIVPAHNEEESLGQCIRSILDADFHGKKEVIVVDDGSIDRTHGVASGFKGISVIRQKHSGKAASLNRALEQATGELIAVVDGDSFISRNSLVEMSKEVSREGTAAASCVVKIANRKRLLTIWPHLEQLYNSLVRLILSKIGANIVTPGPLAVYRKKELVDVGGFSTEGFSEDIDVTIRLIRNGYHVGFSEKALSETNFPYDWKGFLRQRTRFARGMLNIFKRHIQINNTIIDIYSLPLLVFAYVQAVIMGSFTIYQIVSGYIQYFVSAGIYFNLSVAKFLFEWFSIVGFIRWVGDLVVGASPWTIAAAIGVAATFLSYPLFLIAIFKYDRKLDFFHMIAIFFMQPFWWFLMVIYILCLPEMLRKKQYNIWKKNE